MKIGAFIIHLGRAERRHAHIEALRAALPMPVHVVDAIDGASLSEAEKAAVYRPKLHRPRYPFALSDSEIGCFLSHRKAWQALLDSDFDAALVLEDDVELDLGPFTASLELASGAVGRGRLVRFPNRLHGDKGSVVISSNGSALIEPRRVGLGMVTLMLDREAAGTLLAQSGQFDRPVDTFIQMRWQHGVPIRAVRPSGVSEISGQLGGSTIHRRATGLGAKAAREVARALYRLALLARQSRHGRRR